MRRMREVHTQTDRLLMERGSSAIRLWSVYVAV